jgi:catechol 2,3-dioxygenase
VSAAQPSPKHSDSGALPLSFSHMGFYVTDLPVMEEFYSRMLGFVVTDRGEARGAPIVFLSGDPREHHQVVLVGGRPAGAFTQINQISFRVPQLEDVQAAWRRAKDAPGVQRLYGTNHGNAWSLYIFDPEGNRIEIFCDSDWYIPQPRTDDLDLSKSADDIRAESERFCRSCEGYMPITEYQQGVAEKIAAGRR